MAGYLSPYLKAKIADYVFGGAAFTPATTLYLAAFTTSPGQLCTAGVEVTVANNYSRVSITNNLTTGFSAFASNIKNMLAQTFLQASGPWPSSGVLPVVSVALLDASTGGNFYAYFDLTTSQSITTGGTLSFNTNDVNSTWT